MTSMDQERWTRVKGRLRAELGEDVYSSWFARVDLEGLDDEAVRMSVPTRFLKSWIQSHYAERVLTCWQSEQPTVGRIELTVRSGILRPLPTKPVQPEAHAPLRNGDGRSDGFGLRVGTSPLSSVITRFVASVISTHTPWFGAAP